MERRTVLAGVSLFAVSAAAGCLSNSNDNSPTEVDADLFHVVGDAYRSARYNPREQDSPRYRQITDMETALEVIQTEARSQDDGDFFENVTSRDGAIDGVEDFIDNTDFSEEYLMIVVDGYYSSQHWFEVASIDRGDDDHVTVNISVESADQTPDDAHAHTGLIRMQDETPPSPERLSVSVAGVVSERFDT